MATDNMYAQTNLNVRQGPSLTEPILFTVKKGAIVVATTGVSAPAGKVSTKDVEKSAYDTSGPQQSAGVKSPYQEPKKLNNMWVYVTYAGKSGWAAIAHSGKIYLATSKPAPGKVITDKSGKPVVGKDGKPVTQEEESNMLPLILGGAAVVFLILAASKK
jgi:uncharacterized protein YraI